MVAAQPSGTVTLVFTDIEGSTRLLGELGVEAYREALAEHRRIMREASSRHEGYEVDYEGDGFFYAFATASAAVAAVGEAMTGLAGGPIRVRVGIHTGQPELDPPKYVGLDVHRAARIMASANGGQVVLSPSTVALLEPGSVELRELGAHRLKDLSAPVVLHQLELEGLPATFPPLRTLYASNLPTPMTPFLGREQEVHAVAGLLADPATRLVTLTGPGGVGKTRLALQAAAEASAAFPDGVHWVPLASVRDSQHVLSTIASTLHVSERPGTALDQLLSERLLGQRVLVVVDNLEHLLPSAAEAITTVAAAGDAMTVLATSRERLQVSAETAWPVPQLSEQDAVQLLRARAKGVGVELDNDAAAAKLCHLLDDLPLAIELAASRLTVFDLSTLLGRLGARLDLLRGNRDSDPRQQTLRATVDWSYQLLERNEQKVYRAFSMFASSATMETAECVCGADPDTVQSLVDKSLLRTRDTRHARRYWMLETIRQHAADELDAHGETNTVADRHAERMAALLEQAQPRDGVVFDPQGVEGLGEDELPELRLALPRILGHSHGRAASLAGIAGLAWTVSGQPLQEAEAVVETMYRTVTDPPMDAVIPAEAMLSWLNVLRGDAESAVHRAQAVLELEGGRRFVVWTIIALLAGSNADTIASGSDRSRMGERALDLAREARQPFQVGASLAALGYNAALTGDLREAQALYGAALVHAAEHRYQVHEANALQNLGSIALDLGQPERAEQFAGRALDLEFNDPAFIARAVICRNAAEALAGRRHDREAAVLIAACDRVIAHSGIFEDPMEKRLRDEALQRIEAVIGPDQLTNAIAAGGELPIEEAIVLAQRLLAS